MQVRRRLARSVFDLVAKMFLRDNFIHGDLHAGNLLFDADNGVLTVHSILSFSLRRSVKLSHNMSG